LAVMRQHANALVIFVIASALAVSAVYLGGG
jgi:hypothetical protein